MQSSTMTSPFRLPPPEPRHQATCNEFSVAVAKLIERRGRIAVERPPLLPRVDAAGEDLGVPRRGWWPRAPMLRGVLVALPALALAVTAAWLVSGGAAPRPAAPIRATLPPPAVPVAAPMPEAMTADVPTPSPPRAEAAPSAVAPSSPPAPDPAPAVVATVMPALSPPLTREEVREIQSRLSGLGFAAGPADGVVGPQTQAALRRYGEARRLPGRDVDRALLVRLRAETAKSR